MKKKIIIIIAMVAVVAIGVGTYYIYLAGDGPEDSTKVREEVPRSKNPTE